MRELTEEELKLAPEWATHYFAYRDGDILFESDSKSTLYSSQLNGMLPVIETSGACSKSKLFRPSFCDASKYAFSDNRLSFSGGTFDACIDACDCCDGTVAEVVNFDFNKDDAIAIAKHFCLTAEDLK